MIVIIVGSDSDLPIAVKGTELLDRLHISYELAVFSAHRCPKETLKYIQQAEKNGARIFVAMAGGAAHLPGFIAAQTLLPVIGVPLKNKDGVDYDSLLSMVQMPRGVPVATVGINNAENGVLLAARVIALSDPVIKKELGIYADQMRKAILAKNKRLRRFGIHKFLGT